MADLTQLPCVVYHFTFKRQTTVDKKVIYLPVVEDFKDFIYEGVTLCQQLWSLAEPLSTSTEGYKLNDSA